jgi:diacylglycerol O-acyltransferase / wax synthase
MSSSEALGALQRVPGRDAHYLYEEQPSLPMHTLKLLRFATPPRSPELSVEEVRARLGPRIRELAPLRRRLQPVPLGLFHPLWIDIGDPDLELHVCPVSVAAPGGVRELGDLVASLASVPLDRAAPLWQLWVVDGLQAGSAAMVLKLHHAVADGHSSARIIAHLLGGLDAGEPVTPLAPASAPPERRLLTQGLRELAGTLAHSAGILRRATRAGKAAAKLRRAGGGVRLAGAFTGPMMPWNERPTSRRSFGFVSVESADMRMVQAAHGCTSTELVLAIVGGALRSYVLDRGLSRERGLSACVPVSLRAGDQHEWGNHVGNVFVELATELADPIERLEVIKQTMSAVRARRGELDLEHWDELWQLYPLTRVGYLAALGVMRRTAGRPTFSVITSSVTGPRSPLAFGSAQLQEIHSLGVLTEDLGLNITTWSYDHRLSFGVTSCPDLVPDVWDLVERIPGALSEILSSCSEPAPRAAPAASRP